MSGLPFFGQSAGRWRRRAAAALYGTTWARGGGQQRRQGFTGQRAARANVGRDSDPAAGRGTADVPPVGQRVRELSVELGGIGLLGELIDQLLAGNVQSARLVFEYLQQAQPFGVGQRS